MADEGPVTCDVEGCPHDPFAGPPDDVARRYVIHLRDRHPRELAIKTNEAFMRLLSRQGDDSKKGST